MCVEREVGSAVIAQIPRTKQSLSSAKYESAEGRNEGGKGMVS